MMFSVLQNSQILVEFGKKCINENLYRAYVLNLVHSKSCTTTYVCKVCFFSANHVSFSLWISWKSFSWRSRSSIAMAVAKNKALLVALSFSFASEKKWELVNPLNNFVPFVTYLCALIFLSYIRFRILLVCTGNTVQSKTGKSSTPWTVGCRHARTKSETNITLNCDILKHTLLITVHIHTLSGSLKLWQSGEKHVPKPQDRHTISLRHGPPLIHPGLGRGQEMSQSQKHGKPEQSQQLGLQHGFFSGK